VTLSEGIRRHGFRKWYERQLLRSHGHLALTFICLVGVFAAFEALRTVGGTADQASDVAAMLLCIAVGLWSLRRYLFLLSHAEAVAHQADCPTCGTYARFTLVQADATGEQVRVCCRQCTHEWLIES